ncbi:piggyBac transposable element-derived protein 4 [Nephila pilipes]|uniref:PiggyBac transposable element-derived protein 4 n=1 Tax=Nephila pilipes TaxID=299642 RepID=A0A8X6PWK5_NEPPI|nr:piggyBac transposable element-derived protein 4 [Nephila pilipes]
MILVVTKSLLSDFSSDEETEMLDDLTQVRNFCEIDTSNPPFAPARFPFTTNPAVHLNSDISDGTLQFLDIFFDDNLLEMIVAETNQYADRFIRNSNLQRNIRTRKREPKKKNEVQIFITLNILQGNVKMPDFEHFWSKRHSTSTPFFFKNHVSLTLSSYSSIFTILGCTKFDTKTHEGPKLHKLCPVVQFRQSFQLGYCSEKSQL